jgi:hypothetical protein
MVGASVSEEVLAEATALEWVEDGGGEDLGAFGDILILQWCPPDIPMECLMIIQPPHSMDILIERLTVLSTPHKHLAARDPRNKTRRPNEKQI